MTSIEFLTRVGQTCTPLRQEMILLSDVLGVSALVDSLNNPVEGGATENSVLGPFYTDDAEDGESLRSFTTPRPYHAPSRIWRIYCIRRQRRLHVRRGSGLDNKRRTHRGCRHRDVGNRSPWYISIRQSMGAIMRSSLLGYYDTQYADRTHPDCRGRLHTGTDGRFAYRAIVPPPYPIPGDVSSI